MITAMSTRGQMVKMVPFYGTVYKSSLYDLIIPSASCESGGGTGKKTCGCFCVRENLKKRII